LSRDTVAVLDCRIDRLTMEETVSRAEAAVASGTYVQHMAINAAKLVRMGQDPELRSVVEESELVTADGQAVVWASRVLGDPLPERVTGVDLMLRLLEVAERRGYRVYILGAKQEVLDAALEKLRRKHPRLIIAGARNGYFPLEDWSAVARDIRDARPDMLFVAISSPTKELFLGRYGRQMGVPFAMGVGGAVDIVAGITRRAPTVWQRCGLEWLYRVLQEPRRMARRYLTTNTQFLVAVAKAWVRRRLA
jgi:N-acetylglucosaminyldiphosphoundecaprenol N-acetyl-beta-D-mannosaminyltransferase